jgi:hypothetical protein
MVFVNRFRLTAQLGAEAASKIVAYASRETGLAHSALSKLGQARTAVGQDFGHAVRQVKTGLRDVQSDMWKAIREAYRSQGVQGAAKELGGEVLGEGVSHFTDRQVARVFRNILQSVARSESSAVRQFAQTTERMAKNSVVKEVIKEVRNQVKEEIKELVKDQVKETIEDTLARFAQRLEEGDEEVLEEMLEAGVFEEGELAREDLEDEISDHEANGDEESSAETLSSVHEAPKAVFADEGEPAVAASEEKVVSSDHKAPKTANAVAVEGQPAVVSEEKAVKSPPAKMRAVVRHPFTYTGTGSRGILDILKDQKTGAVFRIALDRKPETALDLIRPDLGAALKVAPLILTSVVSAMQLAEKQQAAEEATGEDYVEEAEVEVKAAAYRARFYGRHALYFKCYEDISLYR